MEHWIEVKHKGQDVLVNISNAESIRSLTEDEAAEYPNAKSLVVMSSGQVHFINYTYAELKNIASQGPDGWVPTHLPVEED